MEGGSIPPHANDHQSQTSATSPLPLLEQQSKRRRGLVRINDTQTMFERRERKISSLESYNNIMAELQKRLFKPVYLLMGKESYYIDMISDWIAANVLKEEEKDFNLTILYGTDVNARNIMDEARRFPLMAERQVLIVKEAQNIKDIDSLEAYMNKPVETTLLVLCYKGGTIDGKKKLTTKAAACGTVFVSDSPFYESEIVHFINYYIKRPEYNATIDQRAAQVLAAHIGGDLKRLSSELDKLLLAFRKGAPRKITAEIIEERIGISKDYNVFELLDALIIRNALKAHQIAKYFNDTPKSGGLFAVLPLLFSFFQNMMVLFYTPKPVNEAAIMAVLGLKSRKQTQDYITATRNFTALKTLQIIGKIREVDARSKGLDNVNTPPSELLQELIAFILH